MSEELLRPFLSTRELCPENQETPIHVMSLVDIPEELFYRRNHFPYPSQNKEAFRVEIVGEVMHPCVLEMITIRSMQYRNIQHVLECAGNKRSFFEPKTFGEQWERGAIVQGVWKGVPLYDLLLLAGVKSSAQEVVIEGWDFGVRADLPGIFSYSRSLPIEKAISPDTIIAYEYNGKPLTRRHGFPYRLVVPGWYAMASVKWVRKIIVIDHEFNGPFQSIDYQYYPQAESDNGKYPVTILNVNSSIQRPVDRTILPNGIHNIQGIAWTGLGEIKRVEISFNRGVSWVSAKIWRYPNQPYSWVHWKYEWDVKLPGEYIIISRSEDTFGRFQPLIAKWNRKGYGYHAADQITVKVE